MSVTLLGAGLGPVVAGFISDTLHNIIGGVEALRYALVATTSLLLIPCLFFLSAIPKYRKQLLDNTPASTTTTIAPGVKPAVS